LQRISERGREIAVKKKEMLLHVFPCERFEESEITGGEKKQREKDVPKNLGKRPSLTGVLSG